MNLLSVKELSFRYQEQKSWLLKDMNFSLDSGEILALTGKSGCGKTTLLYLLNGIIPRHFQGEMAGEITFAGIEHQKLSLPELATCISLVMQNPHQQIFFPTVEQELAFAPENLCLPVPEIESRIAEALDLLEISQLRWQNTATLSYGQQKLTALAAIYTLKPKVLLLDEISNGISEKGKNNIKNLILKHIRNGGSAVIADHDPDLLSLASKKVSW